MSHLMVVTHPSLVAGFHLAGVEAYGVETPERAQDLIKSWLFDAEPALIAIDDNLLMGIDPGFIRRVNESENLFLIGIPGGPPPARLGPASRSQTGARQTRIEEMVQRAIGIHITFRGNNHD